MAKMKESKEVIETPVVVYVFDGTTSRDLKIDYPELAVIEEFKDLQPKELLFCWYVGNRTSPLFEKPREEKIIKALSILFPRGYDNFKEWVKIAQGEIPTRIENAIKRMTLFNVEYRLKAKLMADYTMYKLQLLMDVDDTVIKTMDFDDRKRYADVLINIQQKLPNIVKDLETGYGIKVLDKKTKKEVKVTIDNLG